MNIVKKNLALSASVALIIVTMTGCASQIAALKPVGGDALAGVRTATIDLVLAEGFEFLEAPVCTQSETEITCLGSTTENIEVISQSLLDGNKLVLVKLGTQTIYQGSISDVLEKAARGEL